MEVLAHLIYEYRKRLRSLALFTFHSSKLEKVEERLRNHGIKFIVQHVSETKMNVFFGDEPCIKIVEKFADRMLYELTPEEDFILGIMLGYDRMQQCERYIHRNQLQSSRYNFQIINGNTAQVCYH